mgnify:CR=1 FL=1
MRKKRVLPVRLKCRAQQRHLDRHLVIRARGRLYEQLLGKAQLYKCRLPKMVDIIFRLKLVFIYRK